MWEWKGWNKNIWKKVYTKGLQTHAYHQVERLFFSNIHLLCKLIVVPIKKYQKGTAIITITAICTLYLTHSAFQVHLDDRILQTDRGLLIRRVLKRDVGTYQCHAMEHGFTQILLGITLEVVSSTSSSVSNLPSDAPFRLDPRSGGGPPMTNQKLWYRDFMQLVDHPNLSAVDQICEQVWARKNTGSDQVEKSFPAPVKDALPLGPAVHPPKKWKHLQEIRKGRNRRTHDGKPNPRAPRSAGE